MAKNLPRIEHVRPNYNYTVPPVADRPLPPPEPAGSPPDSATMFDFIKKIALRSVVPFIQKNVSIYAALASDPGHIVLKITVSGIVLIDRTIPLKKQEPPM